MADIIASIQDAYQALCRLETSESGVDIVFINGIRFLGIDIDRKTDVNLARAREILLESFPTHEKLRILQVIGDSGTPFGSDKLPFVQQLLDGFATNDTAMEYGFTRSERDANWFVEDLATRNPATSRLIGNIVQETMKSINPPAWSAFPKIEHLAFVYRSKDPPTTFGDDVWLSDGVMNGEAGDTVICLEGGPQAFTQCVNVLLAKVKVIAVTGLREDKATQKFSAAGLLACIMQEGLSEENASAYLTQNPPKNEKQCDGIREDLRRLVEFGFQVTDLPIELHFA